MAEKPNRTQNRRINNTPNRTQIYNNSSSAYAYDYESTPTPRTRRILKRGTREVIVEATDKNARPSIWVYVSIFAIATSIGLCVTFHSLAATQVMANQSLRNELKAMQSRTSELTVLASQSMDLGEVERIARTKLEMSEPQIHQIVYINVPKQNYTVHMQDTEQVYAKADSGFSGLLKNIFAGD